MLAPHPTITMSPPSVRRGALGSSTGLTSIGNVPVYTDYVLLHKPGHVLDSFVLGSSSKQQAPIVVAATEDRVWVSGKAGKGRVSASRAASLSLSVNAFGASA